MDDVSTVPADLLGTAFARLGQIAPNPADTYYGLVFRFAGPCPPVADVQARVASRIARLPRLTERIVARQTVQWERDPDFDVARHVRTLPRHTGVLSAHEILPDGPDVTWGLWLAEDEDGWRLYYLVHHARQDAAAALRTVITLLGEEDSPAEGPPAPARPRGKSALAPIALDLARMRFPGPPVPRKAYGQGRAIASAEVDVALLTEVADRTGATVNQVHLAAMSWALDRWSPRPEVSRRPVNVPVDTRAAGDSLMANRLGFMRVGLPCGEADVETRLRTVRAAAGRGRTERYRRVWAAITGGGGHPVAASVMQKITDHTQVAMTLSSLRVPGTLTLAGAPVVAVTALPWLPPAHECFGFFATYGDRAVLTVLAPEGAPDPAALAAYWSEAVHAYSQRDVSVGTR